MIYVGIGLFLTQFTACAPKENNLSEDPAKSHGRLDPEAQRRLANPQRTAQELEEEIKELQDKVKELENQIDIEKLGRDS